MLLSFSADNYKNFANGFTLSMVPNMKQKDLEYSILHERLQSGEVCNALSSAVIYGPNASGKSNLIGAMDTFKQILGRGHVRNVPAVSGGNYAASNLKLMPNRYCDAEKPVTFAIRFVADGVLFEYSFAADIGGFMNTAREHKVTAETLAVNGRSVFERTGNGIVFGDLDHISAEIWGPTPDRRDERATMAAQMVQASELFLMNGFRTSVSGEIPRRMSNWLEHGLIVLCESQNLRLRVEDRDCDSPRDGNQFALLRGADILLSEIGSNAECAGYLFGNAPAGRLAVGVADMEGETCILPAEVYESYGTIRLLEMGPVLVHALEYGATLVVDEFETSLHPAIGGGIISAFHNDEINTNGAQLIINTHEVSHLDGGLYRRDEIHLVEPHGVKESSELYSLSDFGTAGDNGVRKSGSYMRKYLSERYGAYPQVDIGKLLLSLWNLRKRTPDAASDASACEGDDGLDAEMLRTVRE